MIQAAFSRTRAVMMILMFVIMAGAVSYLGIAKEAEPDIPIPLIYVSMTHEGISPEDAERLLLRPMEKALKSIAGLKELRSTAGEGYAAVTLEFDAGFNSDQALRKVREKVDETKSKLPADTDEPTVNEVNTSLFPILNVVLSGDVPERTLVRLARQMRDRFEALPGVLEVDIGGDRTDLMEIIVRPDVLETYNISFEQLLSFVQRNNKLVAAGALDTGKGRMVLKVPGVIENVRDLLRMPVKVSNGHVVTFSDVATIRRTFKDPDGFARVDGKPALGLEIKKRLGANIIATVEAVKKEVAAIQKTLPPSLKISFTQDKSDDIRTMLGDLENNVLTAVLLVMLVIIAALGVRSSILVGLAIPGSFLAGILILSFIGVTLNIVVLFSLILVVGMLVDGAIVTTELADRKMAEGDEPKAAFAYAARRMAWPIIASTATTLAVFTPLLFWPGIVGEFMKYLPITVLVTLGASLFMALIFIPVLGGVIGKRPAVDPATVTREKIAESGDLTKLTGVAGWYVRRMRTILKHPGKVLAAVLLLLVGAYVTYGQFGRGVEFFPSVEPKFAQIQIRARGDMSIWEKDGIVREVEKRIVGMKEMRTVYAKTIGARQKQNLTEDTIGTITVEFIAWNKRRKAEEIRAEIKRRTADIPGIIVDAQEERRGPSSGKPIVIAISSDNQRTLGLWVQRIRDVVAGTPKVVDIEDNRALPGIEWRLLVDREKAARFGADIAVLGQAVRLVTGGIQVADYRPEDADEEVDIVLRFPVRNRSLQQLQSLRVPTNQGLVPISNFVVLKPGPKTGLIERVDSRRTITIQAGVAAGANTADRAQAIQAALKKLDIPTSVRVTFKGETKDQKEAAEFLMKAFFIALFLMILVLVIQFNSLFQAGLVLSAIIFSTAGVLFGLLITQQPFGIVMGGIGVIALAGIVVNNNIVLIDIYNDLRKRGLEASEALLRTGAQRLRPVVLTSVTTVLGLVPMVFSLNIDFFGRNVTVGAPSTQWWTQLSTAIAGGLIAATFLTLVFTPAMLMWSARRQERRAAKKAARAERKAGKAAGKAGDAAPA